MQNLMALILFIVGSLIGLKFADFDQSFNWRPLLVHRAFLTHGFLVPLLLFFALRKQQSIEVRYFVMGFCLTSAVHLCFDLFPSRWYGFSLINVPFYGQTSPLFSWSWLCVSSIVCLYLACLLLGSMPEFFLALAGLIVAFGVSAAAQPFNSFFALLVLGVTAFVAFVLPRPHNASESAPFDLKQFQSDFRH